MKRIESVISTRKIETRLLLGKNEIIEIVRMDGTTQECNECL